MSYFLNKATKLYKLIERKEWGVGKGNFNEPDSLLAEIIKHNDETDSDSHASYSF